MHVSSSIFALEIKFTTLKAFKVMLLKVNVFPSSLKVPKLIIHFHHDYHLSLNRHCTHVVYCTYLIYTYN